MGDEKKSDTEKEQKSGLPKISAIHVIIAVVVIVLAVIFIAKFGFNMDLISPSSGEMAIVKRPVTPVQTLVQNPAVKPVSSIRPDLRTIPVTAIPCSAPQSLCGDSCVDSASDPGNCGACGNACSNLVRKNVAEFGCSNAKCTIKTCQPGYGDCASQGTTDINSDGCETDLRTGMSWINNPNDIYVYNGKESPSKVYLDHPQNCGSCGNSCSGGSTYFGICDNGACRQVCWAPALDCDNTMTNGCEQTWDVNNCGACGAKCPAGSSCNKGCCWKAQYNAAIAQMEQVTVADSLGGTCSGKNSWYRQ
jgi:hypothetical protein